MLFSLGILFLLAVLIVVIGLNLRRTKQRNRIIAKQIDELLSQREELRRSTANGAHTDESHPEMTEEYAAFLSMEQMVMDRKLFLQPDYGRDDLVANSSFSRNELAGVLKKYADARNVSEYLGKFRVEYAVRLMKEHPHYSIDAVLEEAGFKSRTTFYRTFYKVFGMPPTQYLKSLQE